MELELRTMRTEVRATKDFALEGRAASYGVRSQNLGGFVETIAPGAFTESLNAGADVRCTFNHDPNHVLGRTKSGTLQLTDGVGGLDFRCQLDKSNSYHRDVHAAIQRGDIDQCSFAFTVPDNGDDWADGAIDDKGQRCQLRTLRNVTLVDVSAVTYPAYNASGATQVSARALALAQIKANSTLAAASDTARRSVARVQAKKITAQSDADRRARATRLGNQIAADAETEKKNVALRYKMQCETGRVFSRDADPEKLYPYEQAGSGVPDTYPYADLASAVSAQLPGHKLVGANGSQAFTKHSSGTKFTVPYTCNGGKYSFGQASLGGHPEWLQDGDIS